MQPNEYAGANHFFSQMVYLDPAPALLQDIGVPLHIGHISGYYLFDPIGKQYLKARFGGIQREYELWVAFLEQEAPAYAHWEAKDILDDNGPHQTGFFACAYAEPGGHTVVAFRGSELLGNRRYANDYVTDLALAYESPTPQQEMADQYWRRFGGRGYPGGLTLTGHSLGGNLALYAALKAPDAVFESIGAAYAFNAPGFCPGFVGETARAARALEGRLFLCENRYDPISSLLEPVAKPYILKSAFMPAELERPSIADILYPHSNFMYVRDEKGSFVLDEEQVKCAFCRMAHRLSEVFLTLPVGVRREVSGAILKALYAPPSGASAWRYLKEDLLGRINRGELPAMAGKAVAALLEEMDSVEEAGGAGAVFRLVAGEGEGDMPAPDPAGQPGVPVPAHRRALVRAGYLLFELLKQLRPA